MSAEFLEPLGMTQRELAEHIGCDVKTINRLINGHTQLSASLAVKLGAAFETTPTFWLNLQRETDLYKASQELARASLPSSLLKRARTAR